MKMYYILRIVHEERRWFLTYLPLGSQINLNIYHQQGMGHLELPQMFEIMSFKIRSYIDLVSEKENIL